MIINLAAAPAHRHPPRRHRRAQGRRQVGGGQHHGALDPADPGVGRGLDIGADIGTPVSNDCHAPFKFTGKLDKPTRPKLSPEDIKKLEESTRDNRAAE